jgi:hypothetical protein
MIALLCFLLTLFASKIGDRRAVAEVVVHHLLGIERAHENIAGPHVNEFARGVDVSRDDACGCRLFSD